MKILYIGAGSGTSLDRANALQRSGHEVILIDLVKKINKFKYLNTWLSKTGSLFFGDIICMMLKQDLKKYQHIHFDVAWVNNDHLLNRSSLKHLKNFAKKVIVYINDDPFGKRDGMKWRLILKSLNLYDLVVVVRDVNIEEAYSKGAKKVLRVLMSADEITHAPITLTEEEVQKYSSDVCFVGTGFPERGAFMKRLIELGVPLSIWGNSWDKLDEWEAIKAAWRGNGVEGRDCIKALTGAKICLGLVSKENRDLTTQRSAEIPYSKNLFCAIETTEHLGMYEKDKEAVFWTTPDDCAEKCFALLQQPDKINKIKEAGHTRAVNSGYLNQVVVNNILKNL